MIFLQFATQEERIAYGGTGYMELQFCKMPAQADPDAITAVEHIENWMDDSLYVADYQHFISCYRGIFGEGIYSVGQSGPLDLCGINYYPADRIDSMIRKLLEEQPEDYECLTAWLEKAKSYNGFYILGI